MSTVQANASTTLLNSDGKTTAKKAPLTRVCLIVLVLGLFVLVIIVGVMLTGDSDKWATTYIVNEENFPRAKCSLGDTYGYYLRESPTESKNWFILMDGGNACSNQENCADRYHNKYFTSNLISFYSGAWFMEHEAGEKVEIDYELGYEYTSVSTQEKHNPYRYDWNLVMLPYCTNDGYMGNKTAEEAIADGTQINIDVIGGDNTVVCDPETDEGCQVSNFLGAECFDAAVRELFTLHGMSNAEGIVIGGVSVSSNGLLTHLNHVEDMKAEMGASSAVVTGWFDSGWFYETEGEMYDPMQNKFQYLTPYVQESIVNFNLQLDSDCVEAYPTEPEVCFFANTGLPFVRVPTFVTQNTFDAVVIQAATAAELNAAEVAWQEGDNYTIDYLDQAAAELQGLIDHDYLFSTNCHFHDGLVSPRLMDLEIDGVRLQDFWHEWWLEAMEGVWPEPRMLQDPLDKDTNPTCICEFQCPEDIRVNV